MANKFKIGDYVTVKGLKKTCGRITFVVRDDYFTKYKIQESNGMTKHWNENSLRKIKKSTCERKVGK